MNNKEEKGRKQDGEGEDRRKSRDETGIDREYKDLRKIEKAVLMRGEDREQEEWKRRTSGKGKETKKDRYDEGSRKRQDGIEKTRSGEKDRKGWRRQGQETAERRDEERAEKTEDRKGKENTRTGE